MAKSFDEKYADALAELEKVQKKVSDLKAEKEKKDAQKNVKIGKAITSVFPNLLKMMDDKKFKIEDFIQTSDFSRAFHFTFVQSDKTKLPAWAKDENSEENQTEPETVLTEIEDEEAEVEDEETETVTPVTQYTGQGQYSGF